MCQKIINHDKDISLGISYDHQMLNICLTSQGIDIFNNTIKILSDKGAANLSLKLGKWNDGIIAVSNLILQKKELGDERHIFAINYEKKPNIINMYINSPGALRIIEVLDRLKESIKSTGPESVVYMTDDFGGSFLANEVFSDEAELVNVLIFRGA